MKSFNDIRNEGAEYGVSVEPKGDKVAFRVNGSIIAWMYKNGAEWTGYTSSPEATGTKKGRKCEVADWCLDWTVNGF